MKIFLGILILACRAFALEISITPSTRSYPASGTVEATAKHEWLLWDQRSDKKWKYGFLQTEFLVGAHAEAEAQVSLYPISILQLGYAYGQTSRFYKTKNFDCDAVLCLGNVSREKKFIKLAYELGQLKLLYSYFETSFQSKDESKDLVDELEHLLVSPGGDTLKGYSFLVLKDLNPGSLGAYYREVRYKASGEDNRSSYLVYRKEIWEGMLTLGGGTFASTRTTKYEPSFIASFTWKWGESIALF
jgi:hypothetical protein